jgi:hypothetical protein
VSLAGPIIGLAAGASAPIPPPNVAATPCTALLQNVSPFALQAQLPSGTIWIPPYTQQSIAWSKSGVSVTAEAVITAPLGAPASLLVTFYDQGEAVPANGPITGYTSITGAVVNATISGPVTVSGTVAISSGTVDVGTVAGSISIAAGQVIQVENVPSGSVTITGSVAINSGTVDIGTISGAVTLAANQVVEVENTGGGSLTVAGTVAISSGTVDIGTISGDVTLAANQIVEVENTAGGSVTVVGTVAISSGTVNVGTISGAITIAASQVVQVENVPAGVVQVGGTVAISSGTINVGTISGSVTIASGSVDIGSGNITVVGGQGGQTNVSIDAPPVSIGTLTILSGHNTATLTANLGNNWTGIVVQVVDEGDTGILQFGVEIVVYDAAGGPVYGDTWSLKSAGNAIVVPITGNIDGGTGTFTVTVGTGGYAVVTNTVVAHVGALLGTGIQYVTTPPLQAINVVPGLGNGVVNWANYHPVAALTWYQVLAFNSVRRGLLLYANWTNAAHCAIGIGSNFPSYFLGPGAYYEMPLPIQTAYIAAYWDILPTGGLVTTAGLLNTEVT